MTLRKRGGGAVFTLAAAALTVVLTATSAMAATLTVKVTNGGTYSASSSKTVLTNRGVSVTCTGSKASGSIPTKTYNNATTPVKVGTASSLSFSGCTGPLGAVKVAVHNLPYSVRVDSRTNSTGKTDGMITGVNTRVTMTGCAFTVTGSTPGYYNNGDHTLHLVKTSSLPLTPLNSARLTISSVSGCAGLVVNGDHPTYTSTYKVSRAIKINAHT